MNLLPIHSNQDMYNEKKINGFKGYGYDKHKLTFCLLM